MLILGSCENEPSLPGTRDYFDAFLESDWSKKFDLTESSLDLTSSVLSHSRNGKYVVLIIPVLRKDQSNARVPIDDEYVGVYYPAPSPTTAPTPTTSSNVYSIRVSGAYLGKITDRSQNSFDVDLPKGTVSATLYYDFGNGNTAKIEINRGNVEQVIVTKCGLVEAGACAARTIDEMSPVSYIACVYEIPICFAILVADCLIEGCPWTV